MTVDDKSSEIGLGSQDLPCLQPSWTTALERRATRLPSDAKRLEKLFATGELILPRRDAPSLVDLSNALASMIGRNSENLTDNASDIRNAVGEYDHLVFVLFDGFGMNFVDDMAADSFARRHLVTEMHTVFPSTTPVALTSLATGTWPAQHSIVGWDTFVPNIAEVSIVIQLVRRHDDKPLSDLGIKTSQVYPIGSQFGQGPRDMLTFLPENIVRSDYSNYWSNGAPQQGFKKLSIAFKAVVQRIQSAKAPTFTYVYAPNIDKIAHDVGTDHRKTLAKVSQYDRELAKLRDALPANGRIIVTADHGHLNAGSDRRVVINSDDPMMSLLDFEPSGDKRVVYFHVKEAQLDSFDDMFRERFNDSWLLLSVDGAESLELFGPETISTATKQRIGNRIALSVSEDIFSFRYADAEPGTGNPNVSHHSGLSPAEIRIPLIVS